MLIDKEEEKKRAIETFDHLLWEAIAKICKEAISKSYSLKNNKVRVVYETKVDPRNCFEEILKNIKIMISQNLPIEKKHVKGFDELKKICSRDEYLEFAKYALEKRLENRRNIIKISTAMCLEVYEEQSAEQGRKHTAEKKRIQLLENLIKKEGNCPIEFVQIGTVICCPCAGQHVKSTGELENFNIDILNPKKKGKNVYEFQFLVSLKK